MSGPAATEPAEPDPPAPSGAPGPGRLAVVAGSSLLRRGLPADADASSADAGVVWSQRHEQGGFVLAHRIDHRGNARRWAEAGCDRILSISSVGGLRPQLVPGTHLLPDDFIALGEIDSGFDDARAHVVPGIAAGWRRRVLEAWSRASDQPPVDGGVYWQTRGPRLETAAEIALMAQHAHVVGMTLASEAVACAERGLAYAAVCVVDNLANGVAGERLEIAELEANRVANEASLLRALRAAAAELAEAA